MAKSLIAQLEVINNLTDDFDIVCLQEPHFDHKVKLQALQNWITVYPVEGMEQGEEKQQTMMMISRKIATDTWEQLEVRSKDIVAVKMCGSEEETVQIFNVYNNNTHSESPERLQGFMEWEEWRGNRGQERQVHNIWLGDFN
jgi:exonuclease III